MTTDSMLTSPFDWASFAQHLRDGQDLADAIKKGEAVILSSCPRPSTPPIVLSEKQIKQLLRAEQEIPLWVPC